jgi:ElaB/YqjD/DUF883 family membrane-anchored ribosome-binding protein
MKFVSYLTEDYYKDIKPLIKRRGELMQQAGNAQGKEKVKLKAEISKIEQEIKSKAGKAYSHLKEAKKTLFKDGEYMVTERTPWEYEITKWTKGKAPEERYLVNVMVSKRGVRRVEMTCTCPQYQQRKKSCKHMPMVVDHIKKGGKSPIDTTYIEKEMRGLGL